MKNKIVVFFLTLLGSLAWAEIPTSDVATKQVTDEANFAHVGPGTFMMGTAPIKSPFIQDDETYHKVQITKAFEMQKTEVTQLQYFSVMGANPSFFKEARSCPKDHVTINGVELCPNNPVESVSWFDAVDFTNKLSTSSTDYLYRLPTEAEWEYAARAGTTTTYWFGNPSEGESYRTKLADENIWYWYSEREPRSTHAVAGKTANPWGLYDVLGNVQEWVQDNYDFLSTDDVADPVNLTNSRFKIYRGGSVYSSGDQARSALRFFGPANQQVRDVGIRLVREKKELH